MASNGKNRKKEPMRIRSTIGKSEALFGKSPSTMPNLPPLPQQVKLPVSDTLSMRRFIISKPKRYIFQF
jgi:hypothetical protein